MRTLTYQEFAFPRPKVMVVSHDQIDSELARQRGLLHRGDPAVHAHDDFRAVLRELPERRRVQAVALLVAVGDVRTDHDTELPKRAHQDG